jgi:hypothetical protein
MRRSDVRGAARPCAARCPRARVPSGQVPSGRMTCGQMMSDRMPSDQMPSDQMPCGQVPCGQQMPCGQVLQDQRMPYGRVLFRVPGSRDVSRTSARSARTGSSAATGDADARRARAEAIRPRRPRSMPWPARQARNHRPRRRPCAPCRDTGRACSPRLRPHRSAFAPRAPGPRRRKPAAPPSVPARAAGCRRHDQGRPRDARPGGGPAARRIPPVPSRCAPTAPEAAVPGRHRRRARDEARTPPARCGRWSRRNRTSSARLAVRPRRPVRRRPPTYGDGR